MELNFTEQEVRDLRDKVYGHPISDKEWKQCKNNWMRPEDIQWLLDNELKDKK